MSADKSVRGFCATLKKLETHCGDFHSLNQAGQFVRSQAVLRVPVMSGNLRQNIFFETETDGQYSATAKVYTRVQYAGFVEFGTGPRGAENHEGISPEATPAYSLSPWWIHESQLEPGIAEYYHWHCVQTKNGKFYKCYGQPAQPFLYPAIKDNEDVIFSILDEGWSKFIKETF